MNDILNPVDLEQKIQEIARRIHNGVGVVTDAERHRGVDYPADWILRYSDAYRIELQEWVDSLNQRRSSTLAGAADGLRAAQVADALVASMHSNGAWTAVAD